MKPKHKLQNVIVKYSLNENVAFFLSFESVKPEIDQLSECWKVIFLKFSIPSFKAVGVPNTLNDIQIDVDIVDFSSYPRREHFGKIDW